MKSAIDLNNIRVRKARLAATVGQTGYYILNLLIVVLVFVVVWLYLINEKHFIFIIISPILACFILSIWWKRDLSSLPPSDGSLEGSLSTEVLSRLKQHQPLNPKTVYGAIKDNWQVKFILNHLLIYSSMADSTMLSNNEEDLNKALNYASQFAKQNYTKTIEPGHVMAGLLATSSSVSDYLIKSKLQPSDVWEVANWLSRLKEASLVQQKNYGGIGRDWAFGFTPLLNHYGINIGLSISRHGSSFGWLTKSSGVAAMDAAFNNGASAIALIGPDGVGKTSHVYALAQKLIEGSTNTSLAYNQLISLDAAFILSNTKGPGEVEALINDLATEAAKAGHIILFLENSQLFLSEGLGALDITNVLIPILQGRRVRFIFEFTPTDYQRLKVHSSTVAGLITPIVLNELPKEDVIRVLEDTAIKIEHKNKALITLEAVYEAYRLSGRYNQEEAYPGKAIKILEQSVAHANDNLVTAATVQAAIEQTYGIKTGSASPIEAEALLGLEDRIHSRMINQTHAVSSVCSALRRSRAGVSDPNHPIGSFLFLGPTGVGKTELAKSLAAEYFGSSDNLIRLDMTEYQQPSDVSRLLSDGQNNSMSLIMAVRQKPFSVVLLDEIEKAHPNILNLLLQILDEGRLTDSNGKATSFKDCIVICTSNAGAQSIRDHVQTGESLDSFEAQFVDSLINSGQFKPELINRFDELVLFKPLGPEELNQIVQLMIKQINSTLSNQNISIELTAAAINKVVKAGYDPRLGARPMRRALQVLVEDSLAKRILQQQVNPGDHVVLDEADLNDG